MIILLMLEPLGRIKSRFGSLFFGIVLIFNSGNIKKIKKKEFSSNHLKKVQIVYSKSIKRLLDLCQ